MTQAPLTNLRSLPEDSHDDRPLVNPPEQHLSTSSTTTPPAPAAAAAAKGSATPRGSHAKKDPAMREAADTVIAMSRMSRGQEIFHFIFLKLKISQFKFY